MDQGNTMYDRVIARVTDDLVDRFSDTFDRPTVEAVVARTRAELEATSHHPEFVPALVEHYARDVLVSRAHARGESAHAVPTLLFVCEHNECRSHMAAALAEHLGGPHVHVRSAGVHPTGHLNPHVVDVLAERGIAIEGAYPSGLHGDVLHAAHVVVRIGCDVVDEAGRRYVDWQVEDPHGRPIEDVRRVRDELEVKVRELLTELDVPLDEAGTAQTAAPVEVSAQARRRWSPVRALRTALSH